MIDWLKENWKTVLVGGVVFVCVLLLCCCNGSEEPAEAAPMTDEEIEKLF